jgi:hypothetical protein
MTLRAITAFLVLLMTTACAPMGQHDHNADAERFAPITLRVSGFGTYEDATKDRIDTRKRLMARRASQLDAYRNLAERVYGTVVYGSATVNDFVLQSDNFRAYVDSYLRGMKTVSVIEHSDGVVETVVELKLEPRFRQCVASVPDAQVARYCSIPLARENDSMGDVSSGVTDSLYYLD